MDRRALTSRRSRITARSALLLIAGLNSSANATGQVTTARTPGVVVGVSVGPGVVSTRDCRDGTCAAAATFARLSVPNLKLGYVLTPRVTLWGQVPTGVHLRDERPRAFEAVMPVIQYWFVERAWAQAGVGLALDVPLLLTSSKGFYFGPAASVAVGVELATLGAARLGVEARWMGGRVALDAGVRRQISAFDLLLGVNWY